MNLFLRRFCSKGIHPNRWSQYTVSDLLESRASRRRSLPISISPEDTILTAMTTMAEQEAASVIVLDDEKHVIGMIHQKGIIARIAEKGCTESWDGLVKEVLMPAKDIVYVTPHDTIEDCRAVMTLSERNHLPVLEGTTLMGMVSYRDIATLLHQEEVKASGTPSSAKSEYISMILPRKGLPVNTSMDADTKKKIGKTVQTSLPYYLQSYAVSIPHPAKKATGGEDAYFIGTSRGDTRTEKPGSHQPGTDEPVETTCIGVADGVGSWFEKGVDPSLYSKALMKEAQQAVLSADPSFIHPEVILKDAYHAVSETNVAGSTTACIIALDAHECELHAVNLGDSGFVIVHDKKSDREFARIRGTLDGSLHRTIRDRETDLTPAGRRKGAHISYRSPQQLHYFNCPYQLGNTQEPLETSTPSPFETPEHASLVRVPVSEGDLIILATDGLFDNMDESELLTIVVSEPEVSTLAHALANRAYVLSTQKERDSPFARLAKENDILWSGGMPDDITIIVSRVMQKQEETV